MGAVPPSTAPIEMYRTNTADWKMESPITFFTRFALAVTV